jgi:predicted kinase
VPASSENQVLILSGSPGVGKTTTAAVLAGHADRSVHIESDYFFRFIRAGHIEPWKPESHEQNRVVMRIVAGAAAGYAAAGYFTVVDGILIPGWFFEPMRDAMHEAGVEVALAVLRAPLAVCLRRLAEREGGSPIDPEAVERLWHSFADLGDLERHALDVEDSAPPEVAEALARRLSEGRLRV